MREFNFEELQEFDGRDGKPAYISFRGKVYDVTASARWKGGLHMKRHHAGKDLTTDLKAAPHDEEVFERYPLIGVIKTGTVHEQTPPELLERIIKKFPMLRRHPHPMTVHFPIVFMIFTTVFTLLYLITSNQIFETTALNCLGAGVLFLPVVMLTGIFSWWLNYLARPLLAIKVKLMGSLALFVIALIVFTWRMAAPDILTSFRTESFFYLIAVFSISVLVTVVGWFGAKLTFPIEGE